MTPEEIRNSIIERQTAGNYTNFDIVRESGYQGYPRYKAGDVDAGTAKVYAIEQALDRLEAAKANTSQG